jgi:hypothetical protein
VCVSFLRTAHVTVVVAVAAAASDDVRGPPRRKKIFSDTLRGCNHSFPMNKQYTYKYVLRVFIIFATRFLSFSSRVRVYTETTKEYDRVVWVKIKKAVPATVPLRGVCHAARAERCERETDRCPEQRVDETRIGDRQAEQKTACLSFLVYFVTHRES